MSKFEYIMAWCTIFGFITGMVSEDPDQGDAHENAAQLSNYFVLLFFLPIALFYEGTWRDSLMILIQVNGVFFLGIMAARVFGPAHYDRKQKKLKKRQNNK